MDKIFSKLNKLISLSPEEIVFRLKEKAVLFNERQNYKSSIKPIYKKGEKRSALNFFLFDANREERIELFKQFGYAKSIIKEADNILNGRVTLLGREMTIPQGKDWHKDPESKDFWPTIFYADVLSHKSMKNKDVKFVWEINRHQFLIPLAKAYYLTGNEKYAERIFSIIVDWIDANPYNEGVNWTSSLEHAVRIFSWIWSLNLCQRARNYKKNIDIIKTSIFEQAYYISKHLSIYSSPYNHLIGEAAALYLAAIQFPEFQGAHKWKETGWSILHDTIEDQFHDDGITVEQAFFYHHFTLGFYVTCILLKRLNGKQTSEKTLQRVESAIEISKYLHMPDNTVPMRGDIDNARSIVFSTRHSWDFTFYHDIGALLFKRKDLKSNEDQIQEELLWLLGDGDLEQFKAIEFVNPKQTSRLFKNSGYAVIRDSWESSSNYLCFDIGNIAHGLNAKAIPSAAHGHADILSFDLCAMGKPFLIDGGFNTYFGDHLWHKHFRQEEAHNTFLVDNLRQAQYFDRLKWQRVKSAKLLEWKKNEDSICCVGQIDFRNNVKAIREIAYYKDQFWIFNDTVESRNEHSVQTFFQFHPNVKLEIKRSRNEVLAEHGGVLLLIRFFRNVSLDLVTDNSEKLFGWVCQGYGFRKNTASLIANWRTNRMNNTLPFIMIPVNKKLKPEVIWDTEKHSGYFKTDRICQNFFLDNTSKLVV